MIRRVQISDAEAIAAIYNRYVLDTDISFEEEPVSAAQMASRIAAISADYPFLVWEEGGAIKGYCYAHAWKSFAAYRYTAETTVYLSPDAKCQGIGTLLMQRLIEECRQIGLKALIACITDGNAASFALHEKLGFSRVSHFRAVGHKHGRPLDVVDYELRLD